MRGAVPAGSSTPALPWRRMSIGTSCVCIKTPRSSWTASVRSCCLFDPSVISHATTFLVSVTHSDSVRGARATQRVAMDSVLARWTAFPRPVWILSVAAVLQVPTEFVHVWLKAFWKLRVLSLTVRVLSPRSTGVVTSDLTPCLNDQNGVWYRTPPPTTLACVDESKCQVFCSSDVECAGGNVFGNGTGFCYGTVCRCHRGWSGPVCDVQDPIPLPLCDGIRDSDGHCCLGTLSWIHGPH